MTETDFSLAEALKTTGMSSYKILVLIALFAVTSCKSPTLSFKKNQINGNFINTSFSALYGSMAKFLADSIANDTIKYEARFEEADVSLIVETAAELFSQNYRLVCLFALRPHLTASRRPQR